MSVRRATYLDSSAVVKLVVQEPESAALWSYARRHHPLVSSALARTEVSRALLNHAPELGRRGDEVVASLELIRVSDRILGSAGRLRPADLRSLDAVHLATAAQLGRGLGRLITYDERLGRAAEAAGLTVISPA